MIIRPQTSRLIASYTNYNCFSPRHLLTFQFINYFNIINSLDLNSLRARSYSNMTNNNIKANLDLLRNFMKNNNLDAYIVHHNDPHFTEVPHKSYEYLAFISGFTGSAGTGLVCADKALIWVDGRYFLQAEKQLDTTLWTIMKYGLKDVPSPLEWIKKSDLKRISFDANVTPQFQYAELFNKLSDKELVPLSTNPIDEIWTDRPKLPDSKAFIHNEKYSGDSYKNKLKIVKEKMKDRSVNCLLVTNLDEVVYLFNLRGSDTAESPLLYSYATVTENETVLFINKDKLTDEVSKYLVENEVKVMDYNDVHKYLDSLPKDYKFWASSNTNYNIIMKTGMEFKKDKVITEETPIGHLKAVKNDVELEGMKRAHVYDGVALCRLFAELYQLKSNGKLFSLNEYDISKLSSKYRLLMPTCKGDSFHPISSTGPNSAIIHYRPDPQNSAVITPSMYLLDSGGQYLHGTTDVTRTLHFGTPTDEERHDYTLVLKGHLALKNAKFPADTVGNSLDVLARIHLWKECKNYHHGTGHGVGCFLNVHEGPVHISTSREGRNTMYKLKPGMVLSNEPGYYKDGSYGIRIENMFFVKKLEDNENFYTFEDLTMIPHCRDLIDVELLTNEEIEWLNDYHRRVHDNLVGVLDEFGRDYADAKRYMIEATRPIPRH